MAETYYRGQRVRVRGNYEDLANNAWVDPAGVACYIRKPDGTTTTYTYQAGQVQKASVGVYYLEVDADQVGIWSYRWESTGANTGAYENRFEVKESVF